jgi:hypothetical protein
VPKDEPKQKTLDASDIFLLRGESNTAVQPSNDDSEDASNSQPSSKRTKDSTAMVQVLPTQPTELSSSSALKAEADSLGTFVIKKKARLDLDDDTGIIYADEEAPPMPPTDDEDDVTQGINANTVYLLHEDWCPKRNPSTRTFALPSFSLQSPASSATNVYNTVGVTLTVPPDCTRWVMNICPSETHDNVNVLMHFNPRMPTKEVLMTDRQGTWGL